MNNSIGTLFRVTSFGSSHGKAVGAVIDGCPAGLKLDEDDIQIELNKRRPGQSKITTPRNEKDKVQIFSGVFNGFTDGTPILAIVENKDHDSSSYDKLKNTPRPGHGDYCWLEKYGIYDYRGGGRGSGRTTISNVIGGAIAKKLLSESEIEIISHVKQVGAIKTDDFDYLNWDLKDINQFKKIINSNILRCGDFKKSKEMMDLILKYKQEGDSIGGIVEAVIFGLPTGLGEPVFNKIDGDLAKILMNIGSVKGIEFGAGFKVAEMTGSENNDEFYIENGEIKTFTNNSGGVLGGMTNGMPLVIKLAIKPTPSISKTQNTIDINEKTNTTIKIKGRHDPCICSRVTKVVESNIAIVLVNHLMKSGKINTNTLL